jgi:outer membrane protein TolC
MKFISTAIVLFFGCIKVLAQPAPAEVPRSLSPADFIAIIRNYHPLVRQADIAVQKARAELTISRGAFDPYFYLSNEQKTFDGKNYYNYTNPELKIPTWYGVEVKAGLENNGGEFLNSETSFGQSSYLGISVPIAKNLVMDRRRAVLQQAKIFTSLSEADRLNMINDVLYDAYSAYWAWVNHQELYAVISNTVEVNKVRFELVKSAFRLGDRPAIDTVEALAQLQNFQFLQSEALVRLQNAMIDVSNFLWLPNNTWFQLDTTITPAPKWNQEVIENLPIGVLDELMYTARLTHPKLRMFNFKLQMLEVERKLKFQSLLPMINLNGNLLNKGYNVFKNGSAAFYENNYKFGIDIAVPLRLSEGRGGYKLAKLKIQETNLAQNVQQQDIENKVRKYYNELAGFRQQVSIYEKALINYQALFRGENTRFQAGESSLFLLNTRENKVLETLQKLIELKTKFYKGQAALQWAAGQLVL